MPLFTVVCHTANSVRQVWTWTRMFESDRLVSLRSANFGELVGPRTRGKCYGPCSFCVALCVWNSLPRHLHNDDISREQFTRDLKTLLLARGYLSEAPLRMSV